MGTKSSGGRGATVRAGADPPSARRRIRPRPSCGPQIRHWRHRRGLTLAQLAASTGLNVGYLSQLENDKASPSLETLAALGDALGVPVTWFLLDAVPPPMVVRTAERRRWPGPGGARIEEVDGGIPRGVRIVTATCDPGQRTGVHAHMGEEHHVVLSGRIRLEQGAFSAELGPGDYLVWDATIPHEAICIGEEPAVTLIVSERSPGSESNPDPEPPHAAALP